MGIDITQMIEPARQALNPIGASLSEAWSAVIGDRITAWRLKNAAALQLAVNREVSKLGLQLDRSKIPERYAFAWFEEATKQDEPEIQDLFARLLARAAAGNEDAADRRHVEVLTRFTPMDAKVFEMAFGAFAGKKSWPSWTEYELWKQVKEELGDSAERSVEHLISLGVVERTYTIKQDGSIGRWETISDGMRADRLVESIKDALSIDTELNATLLGISLYKACALAVSGTETATV